MSGVLPADEVADMREWSVFGHSEIARVLDSHEELRRRLLLAVESRDRLRVRATIAGAEAIQGQDHADHLAAMTLRATDAEAQLAVAHDVIRALLHGWEPLDGQWRNESEVDADGTAVRQPMTPAERAVLDAADATSTEAHDGE